MKKKPKEDPKIEQCGFQAPWELLCNARNQSGIIYVNTELLTRCVMQAFFVKFRGMRTDIAEHCFMKFLEAVVAILKEEKKKRIEVGKFGGKKMNMTSAAGLLYNPMMGVSLPVCELYKLPAFKLARFQECDDFGDVMCMINATCRFWRVYLSESSQDVSSAFYRTAPPLQPRVPRARR